MSDIPGGTTDTAAQADQFDPLTNSILEERKAAEASPATTPTAETQETKETPPSRHSPQLFDYAKSVGLEDDAINAIKDSGQLFKIVQGLAKNAEQQQYAPPAYPPSTPQAPPEHPPSTPQQTYQQPPAQPQYAQPQQPPPQQPAELEDFTWKETALDGEENETNQPLKELADYVNKVKGTLGSRVERLAAENAELRGYVQQSAEQSRRVSDQQNSAFWDDITTNVPGLEEYAGKPSQALASPGSPQAKKWEDLAGAIKWRAGAQGLPENLVDWRKAASEAFAALQSAQPTNNQSTGVNGHPGRAVMGDNRIGSPPKPPETYSVGNEYDQRLANVRNMFQQHGGNPTR